MILLEQIKQDLSALQTLILNYEMQHKKAQTTTIISYQEIILEGGEHYAGLITGKDGEASYHLILLPDSPTDYLNWQAAKDWAKRMGGDLPTRREQSLLFANCKEQFEARYHWSNEQFASVASYAWCQTFDYGYQTTSHIHDEIRARAVRRVNINV